MFGQDQFHSINSLLNNRFAEKNPLVAVHRGTGLGMIVENTSHAVTAALRSGADMVEIDVIQSTDGGFYVFHDGTEPENFGIDHLITTLSTVEVDELVYTQKTAAPRVHVEKLEHTLTSFPEVLFNIDRSWFYWDLLLPWLDQFDMAGQLILKAPPTQVAMDLLRAHPVKYPLVAIVSSQEQLAAVLEDPEINLVGVELLADSPSHVFCDPAVAKAFQDRGLLVYLNALNLSDGTVLMAGWDDNLSVTGNPDDGWGRLVGLGADVIQTDWPALLNAYLGRDIRGLSWQSSAHSMQRS
ncbi:glycerophosphodiester phosphodiesterase family protein [Arthrobacter sp. CAL618]|uniref:glycerophosphodiester phosphodiesterase family protein n=1 Tax=Arthrobacter sp. CAL618 TaxID=1055770 RepID=UPI0004076262|nr:glycerophosphodiester phosphodiesterase family protein [Arthrobacter sp. CAL618]